MSEPAAGRDKEKVRGFWFGLGAYVLWGALPIYFKALDGIGSVEIVAHRVLWSVPFLFLLLVLLGNLGEIRRAVRDSRTLRLLMLTALLIAVNWLLYIYAVTSGQILAGSLGYYLNPLVNVLMGRIVLKEQLSRMQWAAVAIAALGISGLAFQAAGQLWISLTLAASFASYGLLRKVAKVDATAGLGIETAMLLPFALGWLAWQSTGGVATLGNGTFQLMLLLLSGVATSVPLLLFTAGARRLRYSTLGMLQFIAPTMQFLIAVFLYGESFTRWHAVAFGGIWIALALYVASLVWSGRQAVPAPAAS